MRFMIQSNQNQMNEKKMIERGARVRVPIRLNIFAYKWLKSICEKKGVTMNKFVNQILREKMQNESK